MISLEERRDLRSIGVRLLGVQLIYSFLFLFLLSTALTVVMMRDIYPYMSELIQSEESLSQADIYDLVMAQYEETFQASISEDATLNFFNYLISGICAILGTLVFLPLLRQNGHKLSVLYSRQHFSVGLTGLSVLVALGTAYAGSLVATGTEWLYNQFDFSILMPASEDNRFIYCLYAFLLAPVAEELIFRGGVLRLLRPHGERFALIASALAFALFHGNLHQLPGSLLGGLWLGYLALKTDSLLMPTLTHMGCNILITALNWLITRWPMLDLPLLALGLILGFLVFRGLYKRMGAIAPEMPAADVQTAFYGSLPMVFYFAFCILSIVQSVRII